MRFLYIALFSVLLFICGHSTPTEASGHSNVQDQDIVVHLVAHSHCDAGYRETFLGYYNDKVKHIITTVVDALMADPTKRFVWEEVSFFQLWWKEQSNVTRSQVFELQKSGRLEFIGGGYVMHDEADNSIAAQANQMAYGLDWLQANLGVRPTVGWHIDPFGHTLSTPMLYSLMNFSDFVLNRVDDTIKDNMKADQWLEFHWQARDNKPIFGHVLDSHYHTPAYKGTGIPAKAESLASIIRARAPWYRTPYILVPFGKDFHFTTPTDFHNMDLMVQYINANVTGMTIHYSTLTEYFDAIKSTNTQFPTKKDVDFFPYIACVPSETKICTPEVPQGSIDAYWTGFYTSKPLQKILSTKQDASLRSLEQLTVLSGQVIKSTVNTSRQTSALYQHHDAIPGTSFNYCTISLTECDCYQDYSKRLTNATSIASTAQAQLKTSLLSTVPALSSDAGQLIYNLATNAPSSKPYVALVLNNNLAWKRSEVVKIDLPASSSSFTPLQVTVSNGQTVLSQMVQGSQGASFYFEARAGSLGLNTYFVSRANGTALVSHTNKDQSVITMQSDVIELGFDDNNRLVKYIDLVSQTAHKINHHFLRHYERNPSFGNIFSGSNVYSFTPNSTTELAPGHLSATQTALGPLVWEVEQNVSDYWLHRIRIVKGDHRIQVQSKIGILPEDATSSYAVRYDSDVDSLDSFQTEDNSMYRMPRTFNSSKPFSGNFYPITSLISLQDSTTRFSLLVARSIGVTAGNGTIEALMHRRIIDPWGDQRGNDTAVIDDVMMLTFQSSTQQLDMLSSEALRLANPLFAHAAQIDSTSSWQVSAYNPFVELPTNVHLLDMKVLTPTIQQYTPLFNATINIGIRLQYLEDSGSQSPASLDLSKIFTPSAGQPLSNPPVSIVETTPDYLRVVNSNPGSVVSISPSQLRSYILSF